MNKIVVTGRLTKDVDLRSGDVAMEERKKKQTFSIARHLGV